MDAVEPEILVTNDDTVGPLRGPTSPRAARGSRTVSTRRGIRNGGAGR
jgi:hypothetical protein